MSGYWYSRPLPHETVALRNPTHLTYSVIKYRIFRFSGYDEMSFECGVAE